MLRHLLRTAGSLIALGLCLMYLPAQAEAQGLGSTSGSFLSDPFSFYYGVYLPNQLQQAMRPTPMDSINQAVMARQYYAQSDRRALTNPISPYSDQDDPLRPYSRQQGQERIGRPYRFVQDPSNSDGTGPSLYYGRAAQYFPGLREGRGRNANVYARGSRALGAAGSRLNRSGGGGGGGGMGGMSGGMGMM